MTGRHRPAIAAGILLGFVAGGLASEWLAAGRLLGLDALIDLAAGWVLAAAGSAAWLVVPRSRVGILLLCSAAGWFIGTVAAPTAVLGRSELGWLAGFLWQLHAGFLVHAVATWPSGRVGRPTQLPIVVGGYIAALFPQLWTGSPAYVVLGILLAGGLLVDERTLAPGRRDAYRPARAAGLLLALALAGLPALARALGDLGWSMLAGTGALYALTAAAVAVTLGASLIQRDRRGSAADLAVELHPGGGIGLDDELERMLREATAADASDEPALRHAIARAAALVQRNGQLRDALGARVRELDASRRRLVEVGDEERRDLLERLRAGVGARLDALTATMRGLSAAGPATGPGEVPVVARLARSADLLGVARAELDALAAGLDPGRVAERGLDAALRDLVATSPVPVDLWLAGQDRAPLTVATTLYFVAAEALANVVRHARAGAAWFRLTEGSGSWELVVEDDGVGGVDASRGTGLRGLRERVEAVGGTFAVEPRPGGGTRLAASVPISHEVRG